MSPRSHRTVSIARGPRALKAARLAGERPERVEIDPATGRITVIIAKTRCADCTNYERVG